MSSEILLRLSNHHKIWIKWILICCFLWQVAKWCVISTPRISLTRLFNSYSSFAQLIQSSMRSMNAPASTSSKTQMRLWTPSSNHIAVLFNVETKMVKMSSKIYLVSKSRRLWLTQRIPLKFLRIVRAYSNLLAWLRMVPSQLVHFRRVSNLL